MSVAQVAGDWLEWNQRVLADEIATLRAHLEASAEGEHPRATFLSRAAQPGEPMPAVDALADIFSLSEFERSIVVLCAAVELDGSFAGACAAASGDPAQPYPTFGLALAALPGAHWSAIAPTGVLRRAPLITVGVGGSLTAAPIRIDERVLHYLVGIDALDERLTPFVDRIAERSLVPSHRATADRIVSLWQSGSAEPPVALLAGRDAAAKRAVVAYAAASIDAAAYAARASALPRDARDLDSIATLWEREARLSRCVLVLECDGAEDQPPARALLDRIGTPVVVSAPRRWAEGRRSLVTLDVPKPSVPEQRSLWTAALGDAGKDADVDRLVGQFDVSAEIIESACASVRSHTGDGDVTRALWETCLRAVAPGLEDLAQRIVPGARWDDLVVPPAQRHLLEQIARRAAHRWRVYQEWGFGIGDARGRGVTALFAGGSGTGKTLAAEILAGELGVDCYRIDLSQVVSKYIGETEKNLRRVFDAAEDGGAVLLFDEADALFGKRSEVRDSHDRYANIEVSFLLQRMESYRGLAILTTNMKDALDHAFVRRLGFIVQFPFPDRTLRAEIWRRVFPAAAPTEGIDADLLGRMNVSGGTIRNIAVAAAFRAADAGEPVRMTHIVEAARMEFGKLERAFADLELETVP